MKLNQLIEEKRVFVEIYVKYIESTKVVSTPVEYQTGESFTRFLSGTTQTIDKVVTCIKLETTYHQDWRVKEDPSWKLTKCKVVSIEMDGSYLPRIIIESKGAKASIPFNADDLQII